MAESGEARKKARGRPQKRKPKAGFVKGNQPPLRWRRDDWEKEHEVVPVPPALRSSTGATGLASQHHTMRLLHLQKVFNMFNLSYKEHEKQEIACQNPVFQPDQEIRVGLGTKLSLRCQHCSYRSKTHQLYDTVDTPHKPGPKAVEANVHFQSALQETLVETKKQETCYYPLVFQFLH